MVRVELEISNDVVLRGSRDASSVTGVASRCCGGVVSDEGLVWLLW